MDFRPKAVILYERRKALRDKCFDLVTEDRLADMTVTKIRMHKFDTFGLLRLALWSSKNAARKPS